MPRGIKAAAVVPPSVSVDLYNSLQSFNCGGACHRASRMAALRVGRVYPTVSDVAFSVVAGILSLDLLAVERAVRYREGRLTDSG